MHRLQDLSLLPAEAGSGHQARHRFHENNFWAIFLGSHLYYWVLKLRRSPSQLILPVLGSRGLLVPCGFKVEQSLKP